MGPSAPPTPAQPATTAAARPKKPGFTYPGLTTTQGQQEPDLEHAPASSPAWRSELIWAQLPNNRWLVISSHLRLAGVTNPSTATLFDEDRMKYSVDPGHLLGIPYSTSIAMW